MFEFIILNFCHKHLDIYFYRLQIVRTAPPPRRNKKKPTQNRLSAISSYIFTYVQWYTTHFTHTTGTGFPIPHTYVSIQDRRGLPLSCTRLLVNHFDHQFIQFGRITGVWKHSGTSGLINKSENCVICFTHNLFPNALHMYFFLNKVSN